MEFSFFLYLTINSCLTNTYEVAEVAYLFIVQVISPHTCFVYRVEGHDINTFTDVVSVAMSALFCL
jgi:hypothetical protein